MPEPAINVRFWGVKRMSQLDSVMSAFDPKRTLSVTTNNREMLAVLRSDPNHAAAFSEMALAPA